MTQRDKFKKEKCNILRQVEAIIISNMLISKKFNLKNTRISVRII